MHKLYLFTPIQHISSLNWPELKSSFLSKPKHQSWISPKTFEKLSEKPPVLWISLPRASVWFFLETADRDAQKMLRYLSVSCCVLWHFWTTLRQRCIDSLHLYQCWDKKCKLSKLGEDLCKPSYSQILYLIIDSWHATAGAHVCFGNKNACTFIVLGLFLDSFQ